MDAPLTCDYTDQAALVQAISDWVTAQTSALNVQNGCAPVVTNDLASQTIPTLCDGGDVTVTWTITDLCETINLQQHSRSLLLMR